MDHWSRRQLVQGMGAMGLALTAGCGALSFQAPMQALPKVPRIGWLTSGSSRSDTGAASDGTSLDAFRRGLRELGYVEGHNVIIEPRYAEGLTSRMQELAAELVQLPVDVIVAFAAAALVARNATGAIPIVIVYPSDPVAERLVQRLARPGGSVTGLTFFTSHLTEERLELLSQTRPGLARLAYVAETGVGATSVESEAVQAAARALDVHLQRLEARAPEDLDRAFAAAAREHADAVYVGQGSTPNIHRARVVALAAQHRLPATYSTTEFVRDGGLMSYGANVAAVSHRAAYYVDRILKGAKPADLPVEQPREFEFVINLKTAQALGLTIPQHVLLQATEVIP
jgi:putative ABC transport system substrate-binding protein